MRVKMSKPSPPAPIASAIGPCPTVIKIVGRPGTGSLPSTIAPPDHPQELILDYCSFSHDAIHMFSPMSFQIINIQDILKPPSLDEMKDVYPFG